MTDRTDNTKSEPEACWVVPPRSTFDRVSLGLSFTAAAHDLSPEFVRNLSTIVRTVQGIGDLTNGGGGTTEGNCGVLGTCQVNRDRCGALTFCGVNN